MKWAVEAMLSGDEAGMYLVTADTPEAATTLARTYVEEALEYHAHQVADDEDAEWYDAEVEPL
jgi:hypothetical protein